MFNAVGALYTCDTMKMFNFINKFIITFGTLKIFKQFQDISYKFLPKDMHRYMDINIIYNIIGRYYILRVYHKLHNIRMLRIPKLSRCEKLTDGYKYVFIHTQYTRLLYKNPWKNYLYHRENLSFVDSSTSLLIFS